ncbi:hypothetical protein HOM50_05050 [bacterium]|jgi:hypothetical protein|nr:hypothetical protein [bacterium]MBT5015749.1 hypothetical protein [bacterium]
MTKKLIVFFLALFICVPIIPMDDDDFEWDDFAMQADDQGDAFDNIDQTRCSLTATQILNDIQLFKGGELSPLIIDALKINAYLHTDPPITRYISDQPNFIKWNTGKSFINADIFLNWMEKINLAPKSTKLKGYLALDEENTVRVFGQFGKTLNIDIIKVLRLFENFSVREAKLGIMFQGRKQFANGIYTGFQVPVYYFARHYNASIQDQNELKANNIFGSGAGPNNDTSFIQDHLVGDSLGLGDFRFSAGYKFWEQDTFLLTLGFQVNVPSSIFTRGLYGSNYTKITEPAFLDLESFTCKFVEASTAPPVEKEALEAEMDEEKKQYGTRILDWLSANLLTPPIGQENQWVVGIFIEPQFHIQEKISVKTRFKFDYLFGNKKDRFILANRDMRELNVSIFEILLPTGEDITEQEATNRLSYMSELIQEKFGPNKTQVGVNGRAQVQCTFAPEFRLTNNWNILLGYDFWWIQKEGIACAESSYSNKYAVKSELVTDGDVSDIVTETLVGTFYPLEETKKAERPSAYQNKIFGSVSYKRFTQKHDLTFSLGGDITLSSSGIGKDFTLIAGLTFNF